MFYKIKGRAKRRTKSSVKNRDFLTEQPLHVPQMRQSSIFFLFLGLLVGRVSRALRSWQGKPALISPHQYSVAESHGTLLPVLECCCT